MSDRRRQPEPAVLQELRSIVDGRVIGPADEPYDAARKGFYGWIDRRPAAIVRVTTPAQIARVIAIARQRGCPLTVRSGGHSVLGLGVSDGAIMIDLAEMKRIEIDTAGRTAWAETGLTAGEYLKRTSEHGLATGFGDTGTVGIGGITLGGGVGFLVRKFGLTIDELLAAEIVTADGRVLLVDEHEHPDLFWAIRGGGGNFGVVTRFRFRLREVDQVYGGMLFQPATPATVADFIAEATAATDDLSLIANVVTAPPMPFIPAEYHGRPVLMTMLVHAGPADAGERTVGRLRAVAKPLADMVRPMRYLEMFGPDGPHPTAASARTLFMDEFGIQDATRIIDALQASTATMAVTQLRPLGGASARVPKEATAYAHRDRRYMVNVAALFEDPKQSAPHEAWVAGLSGALRRGDSAAYVNFVSEAGEDRVRGAYPGGTYTRLAAVKRAYDPENLFAGNLNITPAAP